MRNLGVIKLKLILSSRKEIIVCAEPGVLLIGRGLRVNARKTGMRVNAEKKIG